MSNANWCMVWSPQTVRSPRGRPSVTPTLVRATQTTTMAYLMMVGEGQVVDDSRNGRFRFMEPEHPHQGVGQMSGANAGTLQKVI